MTKATLLTINMVIILITTGCGQNKNPWSAKHISTISGFNVPECTLFDADSGLVYVSSIESKANEYWTDDSKGFISILGKDNKIKTERWIESEPDSILNAPKGMCILGEHLYFTDNKRLLRCTLDAKNVDVMSYGLGQANDLCSDGKSVWMSDAPKVYRIFPDGKNSSLKAPEGINGLTFFNNKLFGVSWSLHEVFELDPSGKKEPVAFGLADEFTSLDGIEILNDGTFIVSDFKANKVFTISPDRSTVKLLTEVPSPADIGLDKKNNVLYVPQFMKNKVSVYQLKKKKKKKK